MDLLIGFLAYTSDTVLPDYQNSSKLDLTVLDALDFPEKSEEKIDEKNSPMNFLEAMVMKQRNSVLENQKFLKGESIG